MADTPDVKLTVTAEEQGVAAGIKELTAQLQELKAKESEVGESTLTLESAFEGLLAVLAVEKFVELGNEVFNTTIKINNLSKQTGISTESLSVYAAAADDAGASFDQVESGIAKLAVTITQFEQGNQKAAAAIQLTGVSLKDLNGLNADQKLRLITDALAKMPQGFAKVTAQQKLLGDGTQGLALALDSLAGEGFQRVQEEAEKAGLIVGGSTAEQFEIARKAIASLKSEAAGMTAQFESGFIPSLTDVANAIGRVTTGDGVSGFKTFGQEAGNVLKDIVLFLSLVFTGLEKVTFALTDSAKNIGTYVADTVRVGFAEADRLSKEHQAQSKATIDGIIDAQLAAVQTELLGTTRLQLEADQKLKDQLAKNKGNGPKPENDEAIKAALKLQEVQDAALKARTANLEKQLQEGEALNKAYESRNAASLKQDFDQGLISLEEYYGARKQQIQAASDVEISVFEKQRDQELALQAQFQKESLANAAKARTVKNPQVASTLSEAATRQATEAAAAQARAQGLANQILIARVQATEKLNAEDAAAIAQGIAQEQKLADFRKTVLDIQGKTSEAAKIEADAKEQEYRTLLASKGGSQSDIDAEIAKYHALTQAAAQYNDTRKSGEDAIKALDDQKQAIQDKVNSGQIFQVQGDAQIRDLYAQQIPLLRQIADEQLRAALATGNKDNIQSAQDYIEKLNQLSIEFNQAAQEAKQFRDGIQSSLASGLTTFLTTGIEQAHSLGQAFEGLASSVVSSLEKMAAQMLVNLLIQKLLQAAGGFSGGGAVGGAPSDSLISAFGGFAEGGHVTGPGTATSDSVPAMLSAGEFVMQAKAVNAIGVHTLAALNRGLRSPTMAAGGSVPKFADGGLVRSSSSKGGKSTMDMHIGLEEGIVLKHLKSPAAGKVVVSHLANNPKTANKALGRST